MAETSSPLNSLSRETRSSSNPSCDTILYTNLGMGRPIDKALIKANRADMLPPQAIIAAYHGRGSDELVFRSLKDFGFEQLPFKRFAANAAFYYTMLVAFFLCESFKQDVCAPVLSPVCYASTLRRRIIDLLSELGASHFQLGKSYHYRDALKHSLKEP